LLVALERLVKGLLAVVLHALTQAILVVAVVVLVVLVQTHLLQRQVMVAQVSAVQLQGLLLLELQVDEATQTQAQLLEQGQTCQLRIAVMAAGFLWR
jgi:hypothetical protein